MSLCITYLQGEEVMELIINNAERVNNINDITVYDLFQAGFRSKDQLDTCRQALANSAGNNNQPQVIELDFDESTKCDALYLGTRCSYASGLNLMHHYWYTRINDIEYVIETFRQEKKARCAFKVSDIAANQVTFN